MIVNLNADLAALSWRIMLMAWYYPSGETPGLAALREKYAPARKRM